MIFFFLTRFCSYIHLLSLCAEHSATVSVCVRVCVHNVTGSWDSQSCVNPMLASVGSIHQHSLVLLKLRVPPTPALEAGITRTAGSLATVQHAV